MDLEDFHMSWSLRHSTPGPGQRLDYKWILLPKALLHFTSPPTIYTPPKRPDYVAVYVPLINLFAVLISFQPPPTPAELSSANGSDASKPPAALCTLTPNPLPCPPTISHFAYTFPGLASASVANLASNFCGASPGRNVTSSNFQ